MVVEWPVVTLGDIAEDLTVGHVGPMASEYVPYGVPFLRSQNVEAYHINVSDVKFISPEFHAKLGKSSLRPGDVVIVRTGKPLLPSCGRCWPPACTISACGWKRITADPCRTPIWR